jgi:molecular chaperone GrpE (heat shock protein)
MSGYDSSDPYAGMIPAYGSPDVPEAPAVSVDLSADVLLPEVPVAETEPEAAASDDPAATNEAAAPSDPAVADGSAAADGSARTEPEPGPVAGPPGPVDAVDAVDPVASPVPGTSPVAGSSASAGSSAGPAGPVSETVLGAIDGLSAQLSELLRLRARDVDLADRLYAENTRLRTGEFAAAVAPLLSGLLRLHDQMASLANGDAASVAGMLRIQLLQILDTAAGLTLFEPRPGERFDATRQAGAGRVGTTDPAAEGTVAKVLKPGFERADGSIVRVAQVEVYRFESGSDSQTR